MKQKVPFLAKKAQRRAGFFFAPRINLVDLVKSFPTNILLQNLASIQKRTSPIKFDHLAGVRFDIESFN